jgi:hypothetical protein
MLGAMNMMKYRLTLILVLALGSQIKGQGIQVIELKFRHSLRIPYNKVDIKAMNIDDKYVLTVKVDPMNNDEKWNNSRVDTTYTLTSSEFNKLKTMLTSISTTDILKSMNGWGTDGTYWHLSFGDFQSKVSYDLWTIDYKTKERGLEKYVETCEYILNLGRLSYRKIK